MQARASFPFKRITKPKSADPAGNLKAGFSLLFIGFSSHILFVEVLILLLKLETSYIQTLLFLEVTGLPEIDMLTPLIIITLSPVFFIATNPLLFIISEIPWVFAGFLTGTLFGPQYDRSIIFAPIIFIGSSIMLFLFLFFSIMGFGLYSPLYGILSLALLMILLLMLLGQGILLISMTLAIPSLIGYTLGKKYPLSSVSPQVFLAQPDRQDPNHTHCQFLNPQNNCGVSSKENVFIPNTCDNRWNQVTCPYYIRQIRTQKAMKKYQSGDFINEIQ